MGKLYYDGTVEIDFEDRVLAHLQIVITAKLRRDESFLLSWRDDHSMGDGRSAIWLHPSHALRYKYFGGRMPRINPAWIAELTALAKGRSSNVTSAPRRREPSSTSQRSGSVTPLVSPGRSPQSGCCDQSLREAPRRRR